MLRHLRLAAVALGVLGAASPAAASSGRAILEFHPPGRLNSFEPLARQPMTGVALPDGRIRLVGESWNAERVVVGLTKDGALDRGFGRGGVATFPELFSGEYSPLVQLLARPDGRLVVVTGGQEPTAVSLLADGEVDAAFGKRGTAALPIDETSA